MTFCRACGADASPTAAACSACALPLAVRVPVDSIFGWAYPVRRGWRERIGLTIPTDAGAALYVDDGERIPTGGLELGEPLQFVDGDLPLRSATGRLLEASAAIEQGRVVGRWDPAALRLAAFQAIGDIHEARVAALDLFDLGLTDQFPHLPLTNSEGAWAAFVRAAQDADLDAAWSWLALLPRRGYRAKVAVLLALAPAMLERGFPADLVRAHVGAFASDEPAALALGRILRFGGGAPDLVAEDAEKVATRLGLATESCAQIQRARALFSHSGTAGQSDDLARIGPAMRALLVLRGNPGITLGTADLEALPTATVDDLIDAGRLAHLADLVGFVGPNVRVHLLSRLAPHQLTEAEIAVLDFEDGDARRLFMNDDIGALAARPESAVFRHFHALARLRRRRTDGFKLDDVRPEARRIAADLVKLIDADGDPDHVKSRITSRIVADPTVWPLLAQLLRPSELHPTPPLVERFPQFCRWVALQQAREHLYAGDWDAALEAADACLALATARAVRDEALNLKACALHSLGRDQLAIACLEEAIAGRYREALLANVGIVAAQLGPDLAAAHLGKLIRKAPPVAHRATAGRRAAGG